MRNKWKLYVKHNGPKLQLSVNCINLCKIHQYTDTILEHIFRAHIFKDLKSTSQEVDFMEPLGSVWESFCLASLKSWVKSHSLTETIKLEVL